MPNPLEGPRVLGMPVRYDLSVPPGEVHVHPETAAGLEAGAPCSQIVNIGDTTAVNQKKPGFWSRFKDAAGTSVGEWFGNR